MKVLINRVFANNIQRLRSIKGLTQEETVAKLNILGSPISRSTYSLIELGQRNIFVSDLVGLKQIFNAEYSDFFKDINTSR